MVTKFTCRNQQINQSVIRITSFSLLNTHDLKYKYENVKRL